MYVWGVFTPDDAALSVLMLIPLPVAVVDLGIGANDGIYILYTLYTCDGE